MDMRGLNNFISDIRACRTKEAEAERIEEELAKIRKSFGKSGKLSDYDRRKYVTKLLYMFMLGYKIDFGFIEAINLLASEKYTDKHIGYLACSLLLDENHELITLITNQLSKDLALVHNENVQCLALTAIANIGGKSFSEALLPACLNILTARDTRPILRKKAALTCLRLFRKYPELLPPEAWTEKVIRLMNNHTNLGLLLCVTSFILGYSSHHPEVFQEAPQHAIQALYNIVVERRSIRDQEYFGICNPWLQVKLLRLLQYFPVPEFPGLLDQVNRVLETILTKTKWAQGLTNVNNATHAILFEAINLVVHYAHDDVLLSEAANIIGTFVSRELNLKYLGLEAMSRLALRASASENDVVISQLQTHKAVVFTSLNDYDISIRRRALDVAFYMCNQDSANEFVQELLEYLKTADFQIREELALKIAILAERFAPDFTWYVDAILKLISYAGDFVSEDIWFRVVQIVTNSDFSLKKYATSVVLQALENPAAHENAVKIGGYLVGEFGGLITDEYSVTAQFDTLADKFKIVNMKTKAILISAFVKILKRSPNDDNLSRRIRKFLHTYVDSMDSEMQQRACEYLALIGAGRDVLEFTFDTLPEFEKESSLALLFEEKQGKTEDRNIWLAKSSDKDESKVHGVEEEEEEEEDRPPVVSKSRPAAATAAPKPQTMDLFDFGGSSSSSPQSVSHPVSEGRSSGGFDDDFLGSSSSRSASSQIPAVLDDLFGSPGVGSTSLSYETPEASLANYEILLGRGEGVLFENDVVFVGYKSEFKDGRLCRFGFYVGNSGALPFANVTTTIHDDAAFKIKENKSLPSSINPGERPLQLFLCELSSPFSDPPRLRLSFSAGGRNFGYEFKIPLALHMFIAPEFVSADDFRSVFAASGYTDRRTLFASAPGFSRDQIAQFVSSTLHMQLLDGVDNNPQNMVAAGFVAPHQNKCIFYVRVQFNPAKNMYRLWFRASLPDAINPVIEYASRHLAANGLFEDA